MARLTSDIDIAQTKRIFDIIRSDTQTFKGFSMADIEDMLKVLKVCEFKKGEHVCKKGEAIDMFAVVCFGTLRVGRATSLTDRQKRLGHKINYFKLGEMLGHQNFAEQSGECGQEKWRYDVFGDTNGILAVVAFGELKIEWRRNAEAMTKIARLAANYAHDTTCYNILGLSCNPAIPFVPQQQFAKQVREFFMKDPVIRAFLKGMDKKDERFFMNEVKVQQFRPGDRVIREGTRDRALFFVISGKFFSMDEDYL